MTKLERTERALELAMNTLSTLEKEGAWIDGWKTEIDAILHPVEVEEVPIELWWVDSQPSGRRSFDDETLAIRCCGNREKPIKLLTTIRREKKVVERSGNLTLFSDGSYCLECGAGNTTRIELDGTFEWTE